MGDWCSIDHIKIDGTTEKMPATPSNPRTGYLKVWSCVTIKFRGKRYAGYIFKKMESGKYNVSIPSLELSTKATRDMLTPRKCSKSMDCKIHEHKYMLLRR